MLTQIIIIEIPFCLPHAIHFSLFLFWKENIWGILVSNCFWNKLPSKLSGLKQHEFILLQFWKEKCEMNLAGLKLRCRQGWLFYRATKAESACCPFFGFQWLPVFLALCVLPSSSSMSVGGSARRAPAHRAPPVAMDENKSTKTWSA